MLYDMPPLPTRINARLDRELARKVAAVQRRTKKGLSQIVKESLELYCEARLHDPGHPYEALRASGFIGCAEGPPDLASSYKEELAASLARKS
jgi:hypothetical protein